MNSSTKQLKSREHRFKAVFRGELAKSKGMVEPKSSKSKRKKRLTNHNHWALSLMALGSVPKSMNPNHSRNGVIGLMGAGLVASMIEPDVVIAMSEVMRGIKVEQTSYPRAFSSMDNCTSTGGFYVPNAK